MPILRANEICAGHRGVRTVRLLHQLGHPRTAQGPPVAAPRRARRVPRHVCEIRLPVTLG